MNEIVTINGEEYIQTIENNQRVLTQNKNSRGFKTKITMCGTLQDVEEFKKYVIHIASKNY